ncbi:MAG: nodulation protein NfeD [Desulfobacteraceae bacterium]|nr:nodulation protein NfeD [Desulfobacteraceae bacterium]
MRRMALWLLSLIMLFPMVAQAAKKDVGAKETPELQAKEEGKPIMIITAADTIGTGLAEFLSDNLQEASQRRAAAVIIKLDTPGGAVESMRKIVQAIYACEVPVVVYVAPSGARAASAGVMITMAADIAAMAPETNIGAAHPVSMGCDKEPDKVMNEKITNDMVAFAKGVAKRRGRNEAWIEKAVRESVSITANEAVELKVVDLIAKDMDDLINQIDGREVPGKGKLALKGRPRIEIEPSLRIKILKLISDPNIAYILMMIGLAGLYFELSQPGAVLPGVIGAISLILAFFAFQTLPVNVAGILLILLSVIFFILEIKVASYGMLSVAGVLSLVLGSMMLFKGAGSEFQIAWRVLIPTVVLVSGFFIGMVALVVRAHVRRPHTGADGLVGEIGLVKVCQGLEGKVLVHGELWQARFKESVAVGTKVRIEAVDGLVVVVKQVNG